MCFISDIHLCLIFLEIKIIDLHFAADSICPISIQIFLVGSVKRFFSARVRFGRSRSSKVIDFGTNRKRVCDFLLVRHSNLDPILQVAPFRRCCRFFCFWVAPPIFHPNFVVFPLHQITHVGVSPSRGLKLFRRVIIFEVFKPKWSRYLNITDRQTTYCGITAL